MAVNPGMSEYGDVIISLENCILDDDHLKNTPSIKDGLDKEVEIDLRIVGCEYIQMAGILLKLPQVAMATAQVIFQRFYYSKSLVKHDGEIYSMASIFLAAKIEESPRRIRDVINVFHHIKQRRNGRTIQPMEYMGNSYFSLKNQVIKAERRILKELGFCVHVKHPHKVIIMYLQILDSQTNTPLAQKAWNYMNDSFRTNIFVRYPPETIGCACIFLSARQLGISLPTRPPWWELFGAKLEDLEEISLTLLSLYMRPKANLDTLQKAVSEIRNELAQKKSEHQADGAQAANNSTPNLSPVGGTAAARDDARQGSRPSSPSRVSPSSVAGITDGKKKKSSSKVDEDKRTSNKERPISRASRRSRSPIIRRSRSRSGSRTRSRSRSRSRSYSLSISPDNNSRSESESSDESPDKQRGKNKRRRSPARGRDDEKRARPRKYDGEYVRKKARSDGFNSHQREKMRERSRSPLSQSRSRSRSRSPLKRSRGKYEQGREKKKREDRHRDRNGVDYRSSRNKGRDHRHRR
ncbi:cyclin-L2-like [Orbicella faveolata]|uniref:cyclin-L2-like n=1 Tax=Orbicella faveolata TaxID=48498 RepID=UPI0009E56D83|nr:cyclin-L2-like [Orbicella faveolata]